MIRVVATAFALTLAAPAFAEDARVAEAPLPRTTDRNEVTATTMVPLVAPRTIEELAPVEKPETAGAARMSPRPAQYRCGRTKSPSV